MPADDNFEEFYKETRNVPCNGCQKCCQGEEVKMHPEDGDISRYNTVVGIDANTGTVERYLQQKPNGDCVYLGESGCEIYSDRPLVCRNYDCRVAFLTFTNAMREMLQRKYPEDEKFKEGEKRLHTLDGRSRRAGIAIRKFREKTGHGVF